MGFESFRFLSVSDFSDLKMRPSLWHEEEARERKQLVSSEHMGTTATLDLRKGKNPNLIFQEARISFLRHCYQYKLLYPVSRPNPLDFLGLDYFFFPSPSPSSASIPKACCIASGEISIPAFWRASTTREERFEIGKGSLVSKERWIC